MNCMYCNSCNLFNIPTCKIMLNCNELQMVITTQKPSYKVNCKLICVFLMKPLTSITSPKVEKKIGSTF